MMVTIGIEMAMAKGRFLEQHDIRSLADGFKDSGLNPIDKKTRKKKKPFRVFDLLSDKVESVPA